MATDLETRIEGGDAAPARPGLKITGLHIRGLKSIRSLDLPEDGLGWNGEIPDFVMVGGINGSGKTTFLEFLVSVFEQTEQFSPAHQSVTARVPNALNASEATVDFGFSPGGPVNRTIRFVIGNQNFVEHNKTTNWFGFVEQANLMNGRWLASCGSLSPELPLVAQIAKWRIPSREISGPPGVVYFPSERRTLISPPTNHKFAGKLSSRYKFVERWQPPEQWNDSLEARLYGIRWEDLNAKEEGRELEANGFEAYSRSFDRFFDGRRRLKWDHGELVVETKSGVVHDLSELSSGEKQVILFMGELLHRWRPGSLILIDEPELHLHESYQTRLWEALVDWQKERGGQVFLATQSSHLFRLAHSAMKVVLSRQSL